MHRRIATSALSLLLASALALAPTRGAMAAEDVAVPTNDDLTRLIARGPIAEPAAIELRRARFADTFTPARRGRRHVDPDAERDDDDDAQGGRVEVRLVGEGKLRLERVVGSAGGYANGVAVTLSIHKTVCYAPCNKSVPEGRYYVAGDGKRNSGVFDLRAGSRTVRADMGSIVTWGVGAGSVAVGSGFLLAGGLVVMAASGQHEKTEGEWLVAIALPFLITGIILMASNGNSIEVDGESVARAKPRSTFALTPTGFVF